MDDLLQRPLYLYDLPKPILESLIIKGQQPASKEPEIAEDNVELSTSAATSCSLCHAQFNSVQEQRQHVKSDLHNYNLKQRIRGSKPVTEIEFDKLLDDLNESISGSDSSGDDSDDGDVDNDGTSANMLSALLKKQARISNTDEDLALKTKAGSGKPPLIWLESSNLPENTSLGIYRVLFSPDEQETIVETIKQKQLSPISVTGHSKNKPPVIPSKSPTYFLCMIGGGHFAAMVVALAPKMVAKHNASTERQAIVLGHKTFHRYTTRRKQGGSQSTSDAAKGAAHSAGSSLRRANEAALTAEVRTLLGEWKSLIDECELVFIRATNSTNRRTLFGPYEGQVLSSKDPRNRGFPFTTKRATQSELMRAFVELTRVKVSRVDQAALHAAAEAQKAASEAMRSKPKQAPKQSTKPSPEEEAGLLHTTQITSLVKRSKVPGLLSYLKNNDIDVNEFNLIPESQYHHIPTILHYAASLGSGPIVFSLLTKCKADPTLKNNEYKTAAEVAKDRSTRDAFRTARYELGDLYDWGLAGVGSALSSAAAAARASKDREAAAAEAQKEAERRKAAAEQLREQDKQQENAKLEKKFGKAYTITSTEKREQEMRGMTPEVQARVERERRARAAEERMKRLQGGT